jgi:hypothetical protein
MPPVKTNGAAPAAEESTDVATGIDDIFEADGDLYESAEAPDGSDDGGPADSDGSGSGSGADHPVPAGPDTQIEPEFPGVQFPQQTPPPAPAYDPENPRGYDRVGTLFADKQGNIVTRDGRVMAARGEPARHWFNMSKQIAQLPVVQRQVEALNKQLQDNHQLIASAKELADLPQKLGISREDYNAGIQFVAAWNKDPLTICRDLVARTMARGFNATDILGNDAGNSIEMSALRNLVNEMTGPQREREQQIRVENENRTNAERNYNAFMARYPLAAPHTSVIATLMRENKITAQEAYHELRYYALENGLDFTQPLGPQIEARQRQSQQPQPQPQRALTYRAPMVAGNGGGRRDHLTNETAMADPNSSWGEILDSVMRSSA